MSHRRSVLIAVLAVLAHSGVARADPAAEGVASALFEQGREEMRGGAFDTACQKFAESHRIDPSSGTLLNLVLCEEKLGRTASAYLHSRELLDRLPPEDDRLPIVQRKLAALRPRVPKLTVRVTPSAPDGTKVILDGVKLAASSLGIALPMDPGKHRVLVTASGRSNRASEIQLPEGKNLEWTAEPGDVETASVSEQGASQPAPQAPPSPTRRGAAATRASHRDPSRAKDQPASKWLGWTATGIGAAGLLAGAVFGALMLDRKATVDERCSANLCDQPGLDAAEEGQTFFVGTVASLAVAAGGLGFGMYVLTRPDPNAPAATARASARPLVVATWATGF